MEKVPMRLEVACSDKSVRTKRTECLNLLHLIFHISYSIAIIVILICLYRAVCMYHTPENEPACEESDTHKVIKLSDDIVQRFQDAIKIKTVSTAPGVYDKNELKTLAQFIKSSFPMLHSSNLVTLETVANYSLLYKIQGSDETLLPYMLCSHMDVVPAEKDKWSVDPFEGVIKDGYIYGRGTVDVKETLMAILEAIEFLLSNDWAPKRTLYIAFGHDEEVQGLDGAREIGRVLESRNVQLEYILDEGSMILTDFMPSLINNMTALVSVTEKGYASMKLTVEGEPRHSSMPPYETPIVVLSKALAKLNAKAHSHKFGKGMEIEFIQSLAPYIQFPMKFVFTNLWLFGPLVAHYMNNDPTASPLIRTTTAVTMVNGGVKENVVPSVATAIVNHRIHPLQSISEIMKADEKLIDDSRVKLSFVGGVEPSPVSPHGDYDFGYQMVKKSIRQVFPGVIVSPFIMIANTDTRYYHKLTNNIYRFTPVISRREELKRIHGHDERILVDNYISIINFYHHLVLLSDQTATSPPTAKSEL